MSNYGAFIPVDDNTRSDSNDNEESSNEESQEAENEPEESDNDEAPEEEDETENSAVYLHAALSQISKDLTPSDLSENDRQQDHFLIVQFEKAVKGEKGFKRTPVDSKMTHEGTDVRDKKRIKIDD